MMKPSRRARGSVAVTVAIVVTVLAGMTGLAYNVGHMFVAQGELQNAVDAAAMAAVRELDGTLDGCGRSDLIAREYASKHKTDKVAVVLGPDDVQLGRWTTGDGGGFVRLHPNASNAASINAVWVRFGLEEARGNALQVVLSDFMGRDQVDVRANSLAIKAAPCSTSCVVPFGIDEKDLFKNGKLLCEENTFAPHGNITLGVPASFGSASNNNFREALNGDCPDAGIGEMMNLQNGMDLNPPLVEAFNNYIARNGREVTVPVFGTGGIIVGFARMTIHEVVKKEITADLACNAVDPNATRVGCTYYGAWASTPAVVPYRPAPVNVN